MASNNEHKLHEFRRLLNPLGFQVLSPGDFGLQLDVPETGKTFAENARLKAESLQAAVGITALADDSGLVIDALNGEPGIYSARYGGEGLSDEGRVALVLERMRDVSAAQRTARFVAAIAIADTGRQTRVFEGVVEGCIARSVLGRHGFGYDPIFFFPPAQCTFGQMDAAEKDRVSHRARALALAAEYLHGRGNPDILKEDLK